MRVATAKNRFQILILHPNKYIFKEKYIHFINAYKVEKYLDLFAGIGACLIAT